MRRSSGSRRKKRSAACSSLQTPAQAANWISRASPSLRLAGAAVQARRHRRSSPGRGRRRRRRGRSRRSRSRRPTTAAAGSGAGGRGQRASRRSRPRPRAPRPSGRRAPTATRRPTTGSYRRRPRHRRAGTRLGRSPSSRPCCRRPGPCSPRTPCRASSPRTPCIPLPTSRRRASRAWRLRAPSSCSAPDQAPCRRWRTCPPRRPTMTAGLAGSPRRQVRASGAAPACDKVNATA
mmetsp:Transcript_89935/g.243913  ORF Transcript_89935/g.243913 Transcript_89935/m.243913 type:complete len:235 (-) Transcript_89935:16-720(-)